MLPLKCKMKQNHTVKQMFTKHQTMIELEWKCSLFGRASGHEKQTAR